MGYVNARYEGSNGAVTTYSDLTEIRSYHIHDHFADDVTVSVAKAGANMKELAKTSKSTP